ncbi:MAG TPA: class I SAM-dependent methyltransferase [Stellaceae bacterium]|nr:class I SAM-dependent methyltransferase [Stellaceae bacterium]
MSRLDSFIRRLEAQRACLDFAAALVREVAGEILELGLGNGRTYDHLRQLFPDRAIYVCERAPAAHPDCMPPPQRLFLGDMRETLPELRGRFAGRVALAHLDPGSGEVAASRALAHALGPLLAPLLAEGGVLVSEPPLALVALLPLELPAGVAPGRYHLYRRVSNRDRS